MLGDTEDVWKEIFQEQGKTYEEPKLVLFRDRVESACGQATSAVGPFYCPGDSRVYLDMGFFDELSQRFKAPGEFAEAYVIAHEIGHHVQNLIGTSRRIDAKRRKVSEAESNALSVRLELQADFYAGVSAHHAAEDEEHPRSRRHRIGPPRRHGDWRRPPPDAARGYVVPDAFTHGTSAQRVKWFRKGFETGDVRQGDTFNAPNSDGPLRLRENCKVEGGKDQEEVRGRKEKPDVRRKRKNREDVRRKMTHREFQREVSGLPSSALPSFLFSPESRTLPSSRNARANGLPPPALFL